MDLNEPSNTESLLNSFMEITSASKEEALFFLESHQWNLDSALSTFLDNHHNQNPTANPSSAPSAAPNPPAQIAAALPEGDVDDEESDYSPSQSPSRSRSRSSSPLPSRSAPYQLRSRGGGGGGGGGNKKESSAAGGSGSRTTRSGIRTLADLNRAPDGGSGSDEDDDDDDEEPQEYYTGGEKSGMLVQDPTRGRGGYDVDSIFDQARQSGGVVERPPVSSSSSRSFTGTGRLLSGETVSHAPQDQPPESVAHTVTFWRNGFTVDNGPLRRLDDPANALFLESIQRSECPRELEPADRRTKVHLDLLRREENYTEPKKPKASFQGVGKTLGSGSGTSSSEETVPAASLLTAPSPATGLVVDSSSPSTSIQLRLADGTRMVSRFNLHHRIRDIRAFIDASRPGSARNYQLQTVGFPPKQLSDADQTIEQAGIANSVVIQKI